MEIYLSLLVSIIGVLMWALSGNPKVTEIGKIMFGAGMLAFLLQLPGHTLGIVPR